MKVFVSRAPVAGPWGGGNRWLRAFYDELLACGHTITDALNADVLVAVAVSRGGDAELSAADVCNIARARNKKCIFRVNDCDARKGTTDVDARVMSAIAKYDATIFVSDWIRQYFVADRQHTVIINGVDHEVFTPPDQCACEQSRTLKIVTHHWSDNLMKGAHWYEAIDEMSQELDIVFTYIGRHRCSFSKRTIVVPPCDGAELAAHLKTNDLYVSGSICDPGPNHIIEAVTCGLPLIVSSDGGGCVEFAAGASVVSTIEQLKSVIRLRRFKRSTMTFQTWKDCARAYVSVIESL